MEATSIEITEMAALAANFVNSTAQHVFLTGKAGTGKTTFLRQLANSTYKRYVILAPTGIAALNAKGVTIHSQFLLPFGTFLPEQRLPADVPAYGNFHDRETLDRRHPLNAFRRQVLRDVDLLIIDEVSMLRADLLDAIDHRMRSVRQRWDRSFGGAQVLFIGDLLQLPPVVKDEEWQVLQRYYHSPHFFEARVLRESGYAHIELDRIFRQQDQRFIDILNNLRHDTVTSADVEALNAHYRANIPRSDAEGVITLTTHNAKAEEINRTALAQLPGKAHSFEAQIDGEFPQAMAPVLPELVLKEGAQVMFVRNDPEKAYFNGKLAQVVKIKGDEIEVRMADDGAPYTLKREKWEHKRYVLDPVTKEQEEEVLGSFEQYPVKLAWAITVHKSQGLTFDKAIIDVGQAFAPGQVYVALSRLRSLDGLILRTRIDPAVVSCDRDVVAFHARGQQQAPLSEQLREQQRVFLHNVLLSTFDLGDLLKRVQLVRNEHPEIGSFEDPDMRTALERIHAQFTTEDEHARRFQGQLARLLQEDDQATLADRISKGRAYFSAVLHKAMKELLQHLAHVEQLSRTLQYAEELREVDAMLVKKLMQIARAGELTGRITRGEEIGRMPELERTMAAQRTALVEEVKAWAVEHRPRTSRRSGRKRRDKDATFGPPEEERKKKAVKGATYEKTYALLEAGWTLAQVAAERSMSLSTIEGHAARGIAEGRLKVGSLIPEATFGALSEWMHEHPEEDLKAARAHFGNAYSFGQLRMVQASLRKGDT